MRHNLFDRIYPERPRASRGVPKDSTNQRLQTIDEARNTDKKSGRQKGGGVTFLRKSKDDDARLFLPDKPAREPPQPKIRPSSNEK